MITQVSTNIENSNPLIIYILIGLLCLFVMMFSPKVNQSAKSLMFQWDAKHPWRVYAIVYMHEKNWFTAIIPNAGPIKP